MKNPTEAKAKYVARLAELETNKKRLAEKNVLVDKKIADTKRLIVDADAAIKAAAK